MITDKSEVGKAYDRYYKMREDADEAGQARCVCPSCGVITNLWELQACDICLPEHQLTLICSECVVHDEEGMAMCKECRGGE